MRSRLRDARLDAERNARRADALEDRLRRHESLDSVTGLPNRSTAHKVLTNAVEVGRSGGSGLAVVMIDIDGVAEIGAAWGHETGDAVVAALATTLESARTEGHLLARMGGAQFIAVCPAVTGEQHCRDTASAFARSLAAPIVVGGRSSAFGARFGIAIFDGTCSAADLMSRAHTALRRTTTDSDGGAIVVHDHSDLIREERAAALEADLAALPVDGDQLPSSWSIDYQPIFAVDGGAIVSVEARMRWEQPRFGRVDAHEFVPIAERVGLLDALTRWTIATTFLQASQLAGVDMLIPVAHAQLGRPGFVDTIIGAVTDHGLATRSIQILLPDTEFGDRVPTVTALRSAGIRIAVDGLGSGARALSKSDRFALVDTVKIHETLVRALPNARAETVIRAIVEVAHGTGTRVIGAGVDSRETISALRVSECDAVQGDYTGRPVNGHSITDMVRAAQLRNTHLEWLAGVHSVYQPVVHLRSGAIIGYEALARGPLGSDLEQPAALFARARADGQLAALDWACRIAALEGALAANLPASLALFLNVEPEMANAPVPPGAREVFVRAAHLFVVVEVTERGLTDDTAGLLRAVERTRGLGYRIAIDDVGARSSSLALLPFLGADVIKLDMSLIQNSDDPRHPGVVAAVREEAARTGATILAEGIETAEHAARASELGADVGQGYWFGRPGPLPSFVDSTPEPIALSPNRLPWRTLHPAHDTPFGMVRGGAVARVTQTELDLACVLMEQRTEDPIRSAVVLANFRDASHFTDSTADRYSALARGSSFVAVFGTGMAKNPADGVRGVALDDDDRLACEQILVVVSSHFTAVLVAVDVGDSATDHERLFDVRTSEHRPTVLSVAEELVARIPGPAGAAFFA